jgi:hypothetical protein
VTTAQGQRPPSSASSHRALFLDRDGTLIYDKHALGYRLFVHTNQSGVARGLHSLADVHRCNDRMEELLGLPRPIFDGMCIAPEGPEDPLIYRKPSPRFIFESIKQFHLDPGKPTSRPGTPRASAAPPCARASTMPLAGRPWRRRTCPCFRAS